MTDKLREAAQLALCALERVHHTTDADRIAAADAIRAALAQQEAQKKHKPLFAEMIAQHPGLAEELAQQDAQAVPQGYKLVPVEHLKQLSEMQDEDWPPQGESGGKLADHWFDAFRRKRGLAKAMLNAAHTPPAQRVMLTLDEIYVLWAKQQIKPFKTRSEDRIAFACAVIEAYERKNGISQPGYTAPDMASQGASPFSAGHDAAQSEIAELEQENRLLRARNDRLQKEIEQKGER